MGTKDERIDSYIQKAQPFAQPILIKLRGLIHKACPDAAETMKWSFPHFDYMGATMCSMASFKQHMAFGFWKASIMKDPHKILQSGEREAMGHFGRITSLKDLPSDKIMMEYIKEAARLNKEGIKVPKVIKPAAARKELVVPDYMMKAISRNKKSLKTFEDFSYSNKKEYVEWVTEAKTEETRIKRLETTVEWLAEGKQRMWKYARKK